MEAGNERLFRVLGDVGCDLIATAEQKRFPISPWRKILPAAACLLVVVGLGFAAAPYVLAPPEAAAPAAAVTADAAPQKQFTASVPTVETKPAPPVTNSAAEAAGEPAAAKERLVFWNTVYYVEAQYTEEEAEPLLGAALGEVEQADREELSGAAVCGKWEAETRHDHKERPVPLEIFVKNEAGYLYCLTYYLSDAPLMEWEAVQYCWHEGKLEELTEQFVAALERNPALAEGAAEGCITADDLTAEQLLAFFAAALEMEKSYGTRTEDLNDYLWQQGGKYVIPASDIRRQLDKYLDGYTWDPGSLAEYDARQEAVVLETLTTGADGTVTEVVPERCSLDEENRVLRLAVSRQTGENQGIYRIYQIRFDPDRVVYEQIETILWEA